MVRATAQFAAYTLLVVTPVLAIHWVAYTVVPEPTPPLPACVTEDSTGCYWDASEQGNGLGNDLWN